MKTPISYYGGKQHLISEILPLIPTHEQYVEPFCGGATIFWAKPKSSHEVINDYDKSVSNFWHVCKTDFDKLNQMISETLHSESEYIKAKNILQGNQDSDSVTYAWAFWTSIALSFANKINGGFAFSNTGIHSKNTRKKREAFDEEVYERIKDVEIFNRDAIDLILQKDTPDTFMYFDPPYAESHCGHYEKTKEVYYRLLEILPKLKCKWLMSSYISEALIELREKNKWHSKDISKSVLVSNKNEGKMKVECLTWNYTFSGMNLSLF